MLTQSNIDNFFYESKAAAVNRAYEEMWKEEKKADELVMEKAKNEKIYPTVLEEEQHKFKYYFDSQYNDYLIAKYGQAAMYRKFGSIAFTQYYHNKVLKKRCVRLKKRFAADMK